MRRAFGIGDCVSSVLPVTLDADVVASLLPDRLELAPVPGFDRGAHPLLFVFHRHLNARVHALPWIRFNYLELVVGVPHVRERDKPAGEPLFHMPRLRLNHRMPLVLGHFYGFAKQLARIDADDRHIAVRSRTGAPLFDADFTPAGEWTPALDVTNFVTHVSPLLMLKLVGFTVGSRPVHSTFECVPDTARLQPMDAEAEVAAALVPALAGRHAARNIIAAPLGAFRIAATWRLSFPAISS